MDDLLSRSDNSDIPSDQPSAGSIAAGAGALGGGAIGAAIGTAIAGPVGTAVGAVAGAIVGGVGGRAVSGNVDPHAEDRHWREQHQNQPFARAEHGYEEYRPAYQTGYEGFSKHPAGTRFEDAEHKLRAEYEAEPNRKLAWEEARPAAMAAWTKLEQGGTLNVPLAEEQLEVSKRELESGEVRLRKIVKTEIVNVPVEVRREEIVVERVPAGSGGAASPSGSPTLSVAHGASDEIVIPLVKEEVVVHKEAKVFSEVHVKKVTTTETQSVEAQVRREEVIVEGENGASLRDSGK